MVELYRDGEYSFYLIIFYLLRSMQELKARNVQHSRNLFDRAVTLLPRIDQLWYKYVYLEELLQNIPGARQVFERWMAWEPDDKAWQAYIKMEERYGELDRASAIYARWVGVRPEPRVWVKWAKFEEERGKPDKAREVFQTALEFFGDGAEEVAQAQAVFAAFAKMETRLKEYDRARVIYKVSWRRVIANVEVNSDDYGSLRYLEYPGPSLPLFLRLIPNLRSSMASVLVLKRRFSVVVAFNTKMSFSRIPAIMTSGLIILVLKKKLTGLQKRMAWILPMVQEKQGALNAFGMCTRGPSHKYHQGERNATGGDIFSYG